MMRYQTSQNSDIKSWREGMGVNMNLQDVMTAKEAAERWGKAEITIRQACSGYKKAPPRFNEDEFRKSGATWLITRQGMERVFGKEINT